MGLISSTAKADKLAHWAFSEGSGTVAVDSSGNELRGALLGNPAWGVGRFGGGLDFASEGAQVVVSPPPPIDQLQEITIAAWVRQPHLGSFSALLDHRDATTDGYNLYLTHQGRAFFRLNRRTLVGTSFLSDDSWHHVAAVWDGVTMKLYVDGQEEGRRGASLSDTGSLDVNSPLSIGRHFANIPELDQPGELDEVRIYNRALGAAEIFELVSPPSQDQAPPLLSGTGPSGVLPAGTTTAPLFLSTDEAATCRWSSLPMTPFDAMPELFPQTGGLNHSVNFGPLEGGETYTFFIRCADIWGNHNPSDLQITFTVASPPPPGLLAHWTFEEGNGETTGDITGQGHEALLVGGAVFGQGIEGGGLSLAGEGDAASVSLVDQLGQLSSLTISAWVRLAAPDGFSSIVDFRQAGDRGYDLYFDPTGRGFLRINEETLVGTTVIADQDWHHLAAVWNGISLALYVDGELDASRAVSPSVINVQGTFWIGRHFLGISRFEGNGSVDDLQVYDRPLNGAEVAALAQRSTVDLTPPLRFELAPSEDLPPHTTSTTLSLRTDENAACRWAPTAGVDFSAMPFLFDTADGFSHTSPVTGLQEGSSYSHFIRCVDAQGNANDFDVELAFSVAAPREEVGGLLASWTFEEGAGLSTADLSNNGHHGTLSGGVVWTDGYSGSGLSFPASSDKVQVDHDGTLGQLQALTISAWVRSPQPSAFAAIVDCRDQAESGYDLYLDQQGRPFARIDQTTLGASIVVSDQTWHHLALVWDGSTMSLYIDGSENARQTTSPTAIQTTAPVLLGSHFALGGAFGFSGTMDEVQIYDRALGEDEILALSANHLALAPGFADKHVVQRRGNSADIPLSGTYRSTTSGPPAQIEGRVVDNETGLPLPALDWQVVDPSPTEGLWQGVLPAVPEGGWYRIELRFSNDPSIALSSPNRIGVGMVIAALGQSSMTKLFTEISFPGDGDLGVASDEPLNDLTRRHGYGSPRISQTQLGGYLRTTSNLPQPYYGDITGAGGIRLVNQLVDALQVPVLVLDYAIDGTSILSWIDPAWIGRAHFENGLQAVGGDVELVLWFQGGTDILEGMAGPTYQAHLETLLTQLQDLLPGHRELEFFVAMQGRGDYPGTHDEAYTAIRGVQLSWPESRPRIHHAGTAIDLHLAASTYQRGNGHLTASQTQILADRYGRAILHWLGVPGYEGGVRGGSIEGATLFGNEVHVGISHHQGSQLQVRDPGSDVQGFELSDDGFQSIWTLGSGISQATISPDGQQVILTLLNPITGPLQLRYLSGMNPFGQHAAESTRRANGNTLFDDFAYHPERDGLPINPTVVPLNVSPGF